jgi:hypothetical protein
MLALGLLTCSCREATLLAPLIVCSKDRHWVARKAARLTWCDRVEATLLCSFDGLFEGPALGCEAWSSIDLVRPCEPRYSAPLIVCSKDRHWVTRRLAARLTWCDRVESPTLFLDCLFGPLGSEEGLQLVCLTWYDSVEATLLCSFDCLFEGPALGCEEGWSSIDLVRPCRGHTTLLL